MDKRPQRAFDEPSPYTTKYSGVTRSVRRRKSNRQAANLQAIVERTNGVRFDHVTSQRIAEHLPGDGNRKFRLAMQHMRNDLSVYSDNAIAQRASKTLDEYDAGLISQDDVFAVRDELDALIYPR